MARRVFLPVLIFATMLGLGACKNWRPGIFLQRTPREQYANELRDTPVGKTVAGQRWMQDAVNARAAASMVSLPYREQGRFTAGANAAAALRFQVAAGERISVRLSGAGAPLPVFLELYGGGDAVDTKPLLTPAPGSGFAYDADATGSYVLLLQGRLDSSAAYSLTISSGPSLAYPATNPKKNRIGSVWGDARDAGARSHEGVDIFAPKGSPALAAAPGRVTRLTDGGLGGKTVWLRPEGRAVNLYYAHLDSQWVRAGDYVRTGDTLGQIGNTGNARHTAAHLHFGIYTTGGAVNPAPFIRQRDSSTRAPKAPQQIIGTLQTLAAATVIRNAPAEDPGTKERLKAGTSIRVSAASGDWLRIRVADTASGWIPYSAKLFRKPRATE